MSHFLSIYVDDSPSLLPARAAPVVACLQIFFARALGVLLSSRKLYLGRQARWIGWLFELKGRVRATLPEDKVARLAAAGARVARWASLMVRLWGKVAEALMAIWFHMLLKPALRFLPLDRAQLAEVCDLLDERARLRHGAVLCDAQAGRKLLEPGGRPAWRADMRRNVNSGSGMGQIW